MVIEGQHVVVVDGVPETAQVLREVFEPRGYRVDRIRGYDLPVDQSNRPGILVVHQDDSPASSPDRVPRIIIGALAAAENTSRSHEQHLQQPFEYAELIRAVESLISTSNSSPID